MRLTQYNLRLAAGLILLAFFLCYFYEYATSVLWLLYVFKAGVFLLPGIPLSWPLPSGLYSTNAYLLLVEIRDYGSYRLAATTCGPLSWFVTTALGAVDVFYALMLCASSWHHGAIAAVEFLQISAIGATMLLCLKCLFVFLLIVLVRVTTPKFKLETITKLGWLYSLSMLSSVFFSYWTGFFLF